MAPRETAASALIRDWAQRIAARDAAAVAALYHPDAQLWGTLAGHLRDRPEGIRGYFDVFLDRHRVEPVFNDLKLAVFGELVAAAGDYTFHLQDGADDDPVETRARFTFVCAADGDDWRIVQHHSSAWVDDGI